MNVHDLRNRFYRDLCGCLLVTATIALVLPPLTCADEGTQQCWLINTRCAPLYGDLESGRKSIQFHRLSKECEWLSADETAFNSIADPSTPTTILIHGNQDNADDAIEFAWPIYQRMLCISKGRPFRLAIWSWPSEKMCRRNRSDVQLKFAYSDIQAYYLAASMEKMPAKSPLCLIGFSMGARITAGGLHLLAGGEVNYRKLPDRTAADQSYNRSENVRAVMVAAAIDYDSLSANGQYNLAISQVNSMMIVRNGHDKVLKWYPRIYGRGGPEALGYAGATDCGEYDKFEQIDVSCEVGRAHNWKIYLTSSSLLDAIDRYTFPSQVIESQK